MKRVRQVYMNLTDRMSIKDYKYVESILSDKELHLFKKILKSEQKHSVRLAKNMETALKVDCEKKDYFNKYRDILIKAALLHDVGKATARINVFEKCILVLLNKITKGKLRNIKNKKVDCYYNHASYSYDFLKGIVDDELVLDIIKNHHCETENDLILLFQSIDDIS